MITENIFIFIISILLCLLIFYEIIFINLGYKTSININNNTKNEIKPEEALFDFRENPESRQVFNVQSALKTPSQTQILQKIPNCIKKGPNIVVTSPLN